MKEQEESARLNAMAGLHPQAEHLQRHIRHGEMEADIDTMLAPLIRRLWKNGIRTCSSCQENEPEVVWVQFPDYEDGARFLGFAGKRLLAYHWQKDYCYDTELSNLDDEDGGCFSIRFAQDEIKTILKLFPAHPEQAA
jgi:hypothetical protein